MAPLVTLTTDFGAVDPYVAAMKGVLLSRAPGLTVVDVSHEVPAHDVVRGAFVLDGAAPWFPAGTVHVAVVDPGVGTECDLVAVEAAGFTFVAPDNGLLSLVLRRWPDARAFRVLERRFDLDPVSSTFHGRDRLAPLAAALALGQVRAGDLGPSAAPVRLADLDARVSPGRIDGRVLYADRFGNLVTSVTRADVAAGLGGEAYSVRLGARDLGAPVCTYAAGAGRPLVSLWGSTDRLELAVPCGSAVAVVPRADWGTLTLQAAGD